MAPVAYHPDNKNAIICVNLGMDMTPLIEMDVDAIRKRMYTSRRDLADDELPIPVKQIHLNKCPFIAPAKSLTDENAQRLGFDKAFAREQYRRLKQHPEIRQKLIALFEDGYSSTETDPDVMLYSGGFFSQADKAKMDIIRNTAPQNLAALDLQFDDPRIKEMLFRFRARNYPFTLDEQEAQRWRSFCQERLSDPDYVIQLENLVEETEQDTKKQKLLGALVQYLQSL